MQANHMKYQLNIILLQSVDVMASICQSKPLHSSLCLKQAAVSQSVSTQDTVVDSISPL